MAADSATIKAIDASAVHRIQSGQVIVNLCSVAKELVENSLDAGATSIEVRFKNQGLDAIEVQDNGSGIAPHNYASLALKHYTSKLATYDDLDTLQTFGFRGEALSSLCALSHFTVTTCLSSDVPRGTRLTYETSGRLGGTAVVAAQRGTTVAVEGLFHNLPVRRRELERNIKREWTKVITLLNQYACIQTGVRFTVTQQPSKGKKVVLFASKGNTTTRDNIINVFGAKTMAALLALDLDLEMAVTGPSLSRQGVRSNGTAAAAAAATRDVRVRGYVSRPAHGQGRQTPDRQMFYVNGRPCKLPQFAQLFGEVYRAYNSTQSPFIFADIQLDTHLYDVNVSPDKQTILLHDQGRMLDSLRESLVELFEKQDITVPISQLAPASSQKLTAFHKATSLAPHTSSANPAAPAASAASAAPATTARSLVRVTSSTPQSKPTTVKEDEDEPVDDDTRHGTDDPEIRHNLSSPLGVDDDEKNTASATADPEPEKDSDESALGPADDDAREARTSSPAAIATLDATREPRKRPANDVVTVTVGSQTVSTPLLSSSKRQRTGVTHAVEAGRPLSTQTKGQAGKRAKAPLPSFGGRLTQMFSAARASQPDDDAAAGADVLGHTDSDEDEDAEMSDGIYAASDDADADAEAAQDRSDSGSPEAGQDGEDGVASDDDETTHEHGQHRSRLDDESDLDAESADVQETAMPRRQGTQDGAAALEAGEDEDEAEAGEEEEGEEGGEEDDTGDENDAEEVADDEPYRGSNRHLADDEPSDKDRRIRLFLKAGGSKKRFETLRLVQVVKGAEDLVQDLAASWYATRAADGPRPAATSGDAIETDDENTSETGGGGGGLDDTEAVAEEKLALTIVKGDFAKMRIVGQFNLGFILAVREAALCEAYAGASADQDDGPGRSRRQDGDNGDDELFIIDQHASDEKYNFERLQAATVVQSQRLVQPKRLELTAVEEEIVLEHLPALAANGFVVDAVLDGSVPVGSRCRLRTLPLSRETTFDLADLEELIALLGDGGLGAAPGGHFDFPGHGHGHDNDHDSATVAAAGLTAVPRPAKVRKMFAMRACRSSIMIGKALSRRQMATVLAHMGEMDKPWNCPHGRPTMRHLCSLGAVWDKTARSWGGPYSSGNGSSSSSHNHSLASDGDRGDAAAVSHTDWARFLKKRRRAARA